MGGPEGRLRGKALPQKSLLKQVRSNGYEGPYPSFTGGSEEGLRNTKAALGKDASGSYVQTALMDGRWF